LDQTNRARRPGSRTRSDRSSAGERHSGPPPGADPRRADAYRRLGLAWGASREAIKKAHRRLVKQHHPDVGGEAEAFRRVNDAYQLLMV
jgi:DnaJ-domain-containing protein 1